MLAIRQKNMAGKERNFGPSASAPTGRRFHYHMVPLDQKPKPAYLFLNFDTRPPVSKLGGAAGRAG